MSWSSAIKTFFIAQTFIGLCRGIVNDKNVFESMSLNAKRDLFGTKDGSVPEYQIVQPWYRWGSSAYPDIAITFNDSGVTKTVVLNIVDDDSLIGPRTTGIWFANHNPNAYHNVSYTPRPDIFTRIEDFQFYHNGDEDAAITIFKSPGDYDILFGKIDAYTLKTIDNELEPFIYESDAEMESTSLKENNDDDSLPLVVIFKAPIVSQAFPPLWNDSSLASRPDNSAGRRMRRDLRNVDPPDVVFPKLLISIDYDVISERLNADSFVRELIAYLNIVDMMYRKMGNPRIRLAITGIILPQDELATPYFAQNEAAATIEGVEAIDMTANYFYQEVQRFPWDNYDIVIDMVRRPIRLPTSPPGTFTLGTAHIGGACNRATNVAVVAYRNNYNFVLQFVHELAHLFGAYHDRWDPSTNKTEATCLMTEHINDFTKLCWSKDNRGALKRFFGYDCSMGMYQPPNEVLDSVKSLEGTWLSLAGQCDNELHDTTTYTWEEDFCLTHYCTNGEGSSVAVETMAGTGRSDEKRCINGEWE